MLTLKAFCIRIICEKRIIEISRDIENLYQDSWSVPNHITDEIKAIICNYYSDVVLNFPIAIESIINYHFRAFHIILDLAWDSHYPCQNIFRSNPFRKAFMFIYKASIWIIFISSFTEIKQKSFRRWRTIRFHCNTFNIQLCVNRRLRFVLMVWQLNMYQNIKDQKKSFQLQ